MKKKIVIALSCLVVILVASMALVASGTNKFTFSRDLKTVRANNLPAHVTPAPQEQEVLTPIANNLSAYPTGTYFSVFGNTIDQGVNGFPFQIWQGNAFTPTANATVTELQAGVGDLDSGHGAIELSLYSDNNGVPGTVIKSFRVENVQDYGDCCGLATAHDRAGIPVTAGTQYWFVVSTTAQDVDIYGWNFNTMSMTPQLAAEFCNGSETYCGSDNGIWVAYQYVPNAFAVWGH